MFINQTMTQTGSLVLATLFLTTITATDIRAEEVREGETVLSRQRPELDPLGVRLRSFKIQPALAVDMEYNDNIFATDDDTEGDFIAVIKPELVIKSDWSRHALNFRTDAAIGQYITNDDENYEDFRVLLDGRLDYSRFISLSSGLGYRQGHERRGSPDDQVGRGIEPTVFDVASAYLNFSHRFNRLSYKLEGRIDRQTYDDVKTKSNGLIVNSDRDRNTLLGSLQLNYDILPLTSAFIRSTINDRSYDASRLRVVRNPQPNNSDLRAFDRDSSGYEVVIGVDAELTGVTYGNVFIGYTEQEYDDRELDTVSGLTGGATLTWIPSGLTTVRAIVNRDINETIFEQASGVFTTRVGMIVDHELLRNLLLNLNVFGVFEDFEGVDRSDDVVELGFGAKYLLNRNLYLSLNYHFQTRDSSRSKNFGYDQNRIGLALQLNL